MRWAVVSDIHGNLPALEAVVADIEALGVDAVLNLGDILSGPLWPAETADRLMPLAWPTLAGNHERQVLRPLAEAPGHSKPDRSPRGATPQGSWSRHLQHMGASDRHAAERLSESHRAWLASLPGTRWAADDLFCCHGTPDSDLSYFLETVTPDFGIAGSPGVRPATPDEAMARAGDIRATLILCGHTHLARDVPLPDGRRVVNPGSVGLPAYDDDHPHPHRNEAGSPHARYAVIERQGHGWQVDLRQVRYDWEAAARQAESNGRGDWADALRSGRVGRLEKDVTA